MLFPLFDTNPHRRFPIVTILLIVINLAIYTWLFQLPVDRQAEIYVRHGFIPKRMAQLANPKVKVEVDARPDKQNIPIKDRDDDLIKLPANQAAIFSTLFTMMFLHGSWLHVIMNMWLLWIFGNNIEDRLGHFIYIFFYIVGGLLATIVHWWSEPASLVPCVGASGAIAAVLGAYAITYPTAKVRTLVFLFIVLIVDIPAYVYLGIWFGMQLLNALNVFGANLAGNVAFWAHIGGFVAGMVLMPLLMMGTESPDQDWRKEAEEAFRPITPPR